MSDDDDDEKKVIEFPKADGLDPVFKLVDNGHRQTRHYNDDRCPHTKFIVDDELATVECAQCGEKLNPMFVLSRLAHQELRYFKQLRAIVERTKIIKEKLENRVRTKCQHCSKMTPINFKFTWEDTMRLNRAERGPGHE